MMHRASGAGLGGGWLPLMWFLAPAAVWATVGLSPALAVVALLVARAAAPGRRVMSTAAVALMALVPLAWFAGSTLPLWPPVTRLSDNVVSHQLGGLAVWVVFLAACLETGGEDRRENDGERPD